MTPVAELRGVHKSFGDTVALADVDLSVAAGEILGLLGPNGAGKTTAIALLLGLRRPDRGTAHLFARDPRRVDARRRCGSTPQETGLPETLRVREVVDFVRAHFAKPLATSELAALFGLERLLDRQTGGLSGGERRRVSVALAFAGDPDLVVLDEPSASLDVAARASLWDAVRAYAARGRTVLLTTHDLAEAESLATRVVVIDRGQVVRSGSPREIARSAGVVVVRLRRQRLPPLQHATSTESMHDALVLTTPDEHALLRELVALRADLHGVEILRPGLVRLLRGDR